MLMTSERDKYPTILLESKAYGLPCVMYSLPYLTMVKDKKGILTTNIGNITKMAEHVATILQDDEKRKDLSLESRESFEVLKTYDLQAIWKEIFVLSQEWKLVKGNMIQTLCQSLNRDTSYDYR